MEKPKPTIQYWEIVRKSAKAAWGNKYLWRFGFLAALSSSSFLPSFSGRNEQPTSQADLEKFYRFVEQYQGIIMAAVGILIFVCLIFFFISLVGRGALIRAIEKNQQGEKMKFRQGFSEGKKYFWPLLGINLAIFISLLLVAIVMAIPIIFMFLNRAFWIGGIFTLLAFLIFIPLLFLAVFLKNYGYLYLILAKLRPWPALENAYALLAKNLSASLIMLLVFFLAGIVFGIIVFSALVPTAIVFLIIGGLAYLVVKTAGAAAVAVIGILFVLVLIFFLRGIYETFAQFAWILFFQEIACAKKEEPAVAEAAEPKPAAEPDIAEGV